MLMSAIEALKKTVPGPIEMSIQMVDPDNGDMQNVEIDVEESLLRKTAHGDWPTMYILPSCETILGPKGPNTDWQGKKWREVRPDHVPI